MQWRLECKISGSGSDFEGTFEAAIERAIALCAPDFRHVVWLLPANIRMAEVTHERCYWITCRLSGDEIKSLMRRNKKTISGLAFTMGITQKRVREVRERGIEDKNGVRDWLEFITGEDPGPLPERYRIRSRNESFDCPQCGCPLGPGDSAYEYACSAYCSVACCRKSLRPASVQA
jgi:hypothetical protein